MSESVSANQIALLLNDPAIMTALTQLLAARQVATAANSALPASPQAETESNTHTVHSDSRAAASGSANVEDENSKGDESEKDANSRYNISKALGINPFDRKVVQARRKEVTEFLLGEYGIRLNKPPTHWQEKAWIASVNAAFEHFSTVYGWKRKAIEDLLKLMCQDNVRNARQLNKKRALEGAEASSGTNPPPPRRGLSKKQYVRKDTVIVKKKTLLRRPNRNTATATSESFARQANGLENGSPSLSPSVDEAETADLMSSTVSSSNGLDLSLPVRSEATTAETMAQPTADPAIPTPPPVGACYYVSFMKLG
ncbi:hypothetical protein FN846DRAFT_998171 [Sphaerosporella brunnea]|uniref:Uncharacterized protein n=1 Tax=Sphaerosporella brunnea TaxID=1250544 RepID=A0A5J5EIB8_9PEZI|nr:hypothetical protein FN846DRAFT_998171 [Sphaerosporella brunnea]